MTGYIDASKVPAADVEAASGTDFAQFHPRQRIDPSLGIADVEPSGGKGYTVNLNSLAIRVGELDAVADAVGEAVAHLPTSCGDFGPGRLEATVAKVFGQWRDNLGTLRDKISTTGDQVRGAINEYYENDLASQARLTIPGHDFDELRSGGRDRLTEKFGEQP
jgi:hypothetical protein